MTYVRTVSHFLVPEWEAPGQVRRQSPDAGTLQALYSRWTALDPIQKVQDMMEKAGCS